MKMRLLGAAVCAATIIGTGGAAFAGEINGKGEQTPIGKGTARNSLCAFSGLQDGEGPDDPLSGPGHVQTPHGEPDYDLYFPPGSASICQWLNNGQLFGGHSQRPQDPPPPPEEP
jgi:hypothetical protein